MAGRQERNFCPDGDIDKVTFTAKQDTPYEVYTSNLALWADTAITMTVGTDVYTDDDGGTGLASRITFTPTIDAMAVVTIVNIYDVYGYDVTYDITVVISDSLSSPMLPEGVAGLTPGLQMMYQRKDVFLPLYWKEWDGLRRFRP